MDESEFRQERSRFLRDMADDMSEERRAPVIGRITQLTETRGIPLTRVWFGSRRTALPGGRIVSVAPTFNLYVYRQDGQGGMMVTRLDPFHSEDMDLTDLEMQLVIRWGFEMAADRIGRFTSLEHGWMWWRK